MSSDRKILTSEWNVHAIDVMIVDMKMTILTIQRKWDCNIKDLPIFSTRSSVSLIPAVSRSVKGMPQIEILASTTSRVVPAIFVTIALSLCILKDI